MKKIFALIILISIFVPRIAFSSGEPGSFLYWGAGARAMGLGNTYVGIVDDAYATYWNPSVLGMLEKKEIGTFYAKLWENTSYDFITYAHPMLDKGCFGFSMVRLTSTGAERRDESNNSTGYFDHKQSALAVSFGRNVYEKFYWGCSGKYLSLNLDSYSRKNFTFDTGFYFILNDYLTFGANVQNIISTKSSDTEDELPIVLRMGTGYRVFGDKLLVALDINRKSETGRLFDAYSLGFEGKVRDLITLRLGRNQEEITFGFGLKYKSYKFDYAMASHYLGASSRLSFSARFGTSLEDRRKAQKRMLEALLAEKTAKEEETKEEKDKRLASFKKAYDEAITLYKSGQFSKSVEKFTKAENLDPINANVPSKVERLGLVAASVPERIGKDKVSRLVRRGVRYFVEGNMESAVRVIAYASSLKPNDFKLSGLKARIEKKTGITVEYTMPASGRTVIDQKLHESLISFHKKDYSKVIVLCEEVLLLEPNKALAYKRLGSALFALGEKRKAIKAWKRALKISPDKDLKKIISELGK